MEIQIWKCSSREIYLLRLYCFAPYRAAADGTRASGDQMEDLRQNAILLSLIVIVFRTSSFLMFLGAQGELSCQNGITAIINRFHYEKLQTPRRRILTYHVICLLAFNLLSGLQHFVTVSTIDFLSLRHILMSKSCSQ